MSGAPVNEHRSRIVLVVGVDLSDASGHLLATAVGLVRSVEDAEIHLVHVVAREPVALRIAEPIHSLGVIERANAEYARWELERLRDSVVLGAGVRVILHTPVGRAADELARVASEVGAHAVVVEAHRFGARRGFHRSVVARMAEIAPCSVVTVRQRAATASAPVQE